MLAYLKFRIQRSLRRFRRDLRLWRIWAVNYFNRHVWGKWRRLGPVRRFVLGWWLVIVVAGVGLWQQTIGLQTAYLTTGPAAGGIYREGLVGQVKLINPILPQGQASIDVGRLIFSGLMRLNADGIIETDLAQNWKVSDDGKTYTFVLKPNLKWHDGSPVTAQDVLFTLNLIQNPDTRSPLATSWQSVKAEVKDDRTVEFTLPNPFAPFIYSTTFGVLPQHLLNGIDPSSLRVADFNQHPVGTGPFKFDRMTDDGKDISLSPNADYYLGKPQLQQFELRLYDNSRLLRRAYAQRQVNAIARVTSEDIPRLAPATIHNLTVLDEVGLFMRVNSPLLQDKAVRQAISAAVDRRDLAKQLGEEAATTITLPLLPGQVGYMAAAQPPGFNRQQAAKWLDGAGWAAKGRGPRLHDGKPLQLTLATANSGYYPKLASIIKSDLGRIGIEVKVIAVGTKDLQQSYIRTRKYDLLLYGISIGPDPDVYAYWQSSQAADPGLNLSEYNSAAADKELESARLTSDKAIRAARYKKFLANWSNDVPAVILFEPGYLYATNQSVQGIEARRLGDPSDRFYNVQNWTINTRPIQRVD